MIDNLDKVDEVLNTIIAERKCTLAEAIDIARMVVYLQISQTWVSEVKH